MKIEYRKEKTIELSDPGKTILEISLENDIPHAHVCGGNARCSTCRVLILEGAENLEPRNEKEEALRKKKGLEEEIRLACQTRVRGDVALKRLVADDIDREIAVAESSFSSGREQKIVVFFSDIRSFTSFSERHLPYDVIHILRRYAYMAGENILKYGGFIDKYIGDGIMALFGVDSDDTSQAALAATAAALDTLRDLEAFNRDLAAHFNETFRIGIGLHAGAAVLGELGHPDKMQFTAIGDSVNMASRVEGACKKAGVSFLVSESVYELVRDHVETGKIFRGGLKGKTGEFMLYEIVSLKESARRYSLEENLRFALKKIIHKTNAPPYIRAVFHDVVDYDSKTNRGGLDGSIFTPDFAEREENKGLEKALASLVKLREKFPEVSLADLLALSGAVALERCGGPRLSVGIGRKDIPESERGEFVAPPDENDDAPALLSYFSRLGLDARDLVALSGAHTVGKAHGDPFTRDMFDFNNSYFQELLKDPGERKGKLIPSDLALLHDEECLRHVRRYAVDQDAFFEDFGRAYLKIVWLGQKNA